MGRGSGEFKKIIKHCEECGILLKLNNTRDIKRKKYCSRVCTAKVVGRNVNMTKLWEKNNTPEVNAKKGKKGEK